MKLNFFLIVFGMFVILFLTQGFQCGSPEFTGAKVQEQNKNYPEAIKLYEKEVQKNPKNAEAWFRLGRIRGEELKDYKGMNEAFDQSLKASNAFSNEIRLIRYKNWAIHINNGFENMKKGSKDSIEFYEKAIKEYKLAYDAWPDTSITYLYLASAYQGKGDVENLIYCLTKMWELERDKDSYKSVGRIYTQKGLEKKEQFRVENAEKLSLQKNLSEIDKGTYKSDVTRMLGAPDVSKKDKKNPKKETWTYNKYNMVLEVEGERVISKKIQKPYDFKIDSTKYYEAVEEFNKAIKVFEEIKAFDPKDNENLNLLLQAYYEANRIKEATAAFTQAVVNEPTNKMNRYILGLLYRTLENYDKAISEFKEALAIDPNFIDVIFDIGATYYNWGVKIKKAAQENNDEEYKNKFREALPWLEKVTQMKIEDAKKAAQTSGKDVYAELKSEDARVWDTLGTIYTILGQTDKAMKALDEADRIRSSSK